MKSNGKSRLMGKEARFGRISAILLIVAVATYVVLFLCLFPCVPCLVNPLGRLGGWLILFSILASFVFGIVGIICDRHKLLAIFATLVSGGLILYGLSGIG